MCALEERGAAVMKVSLDRLRRLELAQPSGAYIGDEPVWRFHHVLIRDVAYRRLLKSDRANLHERLADWVAAGGASVAFDTDEMVARHLEAAHSYRVELGTHDEHTGDLALRSARCYLASARRALDRDELVSAGAQAARGAALAGDDEAVHAELLLVGCEAFLSAGDVAAGAPLVDDLDRIAGEVLAPWATCYRCQFVVYTDPERLLEADARLQGAIDEFGRRGDPAGLAKAHRVRASARARLGQVGDCEVDLFEALIAARQGGDHRQITAALGAAPNAALWGPSPVPKAGGRCLDVVRMQRMTTAAPSLEATSLRCLALLELLRGRPDKARSMLADARQVVADLGLRHGLMETELFAGIIELMVGDPGAAEPHFRTALEGLDALGVGADAGQAAALLARSVLAQGRIDDADHYATESEHLAGHNLKTAIAWRAVRAEILAAQGRHGKAVVMAREAVAVAADTDLVLDHAEACLALRRVLVAAGDTRGAAAAGRDAEALYAAKEAVTSITTSVEPIVAEAFSPTSATTAPTGSRLAFTNRASESVDAALLALQAHDVDGALAVHSDQFVYDDRRRLSGDPIEGIAGLRKASERLLEQYPHVEWRTLAVRGERLVLVWSRSSDDAGNETSYLALFEVGDDGRIAFEGRFDGDDFEGAYRELERRYYAGEGAAYAPPGAILCDLMIAESRGDLDRIFDELLSPDLRTENRAGSGLPDRSTAQLRASHEALSDMVASVRIWTSAIRWLSPTWFVSRWDREAVGPDDQQYKWTRIVAGEYRDGRLAWLCEFELDDEDAAFAYTKERMRASSRVAVTNRASEVSDDLIRAMQAHDVDATLGYCSDQYVFDDRRQLSGDPNEGRAGLRAAVERILKQFTGFEGRTLAVRGERLALRQSRWSDGAGNETTTFHVFEVGDDGRIAFEGRFGAADFEGAYRELERRYYEGEAAYAEPGLLLFEVMAAMNRGDFEGLFRDLLSPDLRVENRSRSAFPDRSAAELRASFEELSDMVASFRAWNSTVSWLSPRWSVARHEREAVGLDGEQFQWARLLVIEYRDRRFASLCNFDLEDADAAFAYAEERMRATSSRLAVSNRASEGANNLSTAMRARDVAGVVGAYSDQFVYDDRRRRHGDPIEDRAELRAAVERIFEQFTGFEGQTLAVRGERLALLSSRWLDDVGDETTNFDVFELGEDGRIAYQGRFEEDDFESAYRELERRYYEGEGAAHAQPGAVMLEIMIGMSRGDFGKLFGELASPDLRVENRSRSGLPDRSAAELRASFDSLDEMVASVRAWSSAIRWLSPTWCVLRLEREAVGPDDEQYTWTRLIAGECRDGRLAWVCELDPDDEDAAFAYTEERCGPRQPPGPR